MDTLVGIAVLGVAIFFTVRYFLPKQRQARKLEKERRAEFIKKQNIKRSEELKKQAELDKVQSKVSKQDTGDFIDNFDNSSTDDLLKVLIVQNRLLLKNQETLIASQSMLGSSATKELRERTEAYIVQKLTSENIKHTENK